MGRRGVVKVNRGGEKRCGQGQQRRGGEVWSQSTEEGGEVWSRSTEEGRRGVVKVNRGST